jgi:FKBP-type peptidyl-prolyl cis-trans isomerase FkpA
MYRVLEQTQGPSPTMQNEVVVNQRILNFDGSVIADTYKSGFTDRFSLQEGLQLMALGSRYEFVIPPEIAWGKRGVGNKIGPNAFMVFDVRLLEIA